MTIQGLQEIWSIGDMAECIDDQWTTLSNAPSAGPALGSVKMVADVAELPRLLEFVTCLRLVGWGDDGFEGVAFRKVKPKSEDRKVERREAVTA